jgi:hypothetical protein
VHYHVDGKSLLDEALVEGGRWRVSAPDFCAAITEIFAERHQLQPCDTSRFS